MTDTAARYQHAQRALIATAFVGALDVLDEIPPETLDRPWSDVGLAMLALRARGETIDLAALTDECQRAGYTLPHVQSWWGDAASPGAVVAQIGVTRAEVLLEQALIRAKQRLDLGGEVWQAVADLREDLDTVGEPPTEDEPWYDHATVAAMHADNPPWVIPDLLAASERAVLTGAEGYGKSTLIYQIALAAAYGVHPLDVSHTFTPQRVMVLDVENSHESQVSGMVRRLDAAYRLRANLDEPIQFALLKRTQVDLGSRTQRRSVLDAVARFQPQLLVMGSGYKLVDSSDWREVFQATTRTADTARAIAKCAVLLEMHAGHGSEGDRNGWRPDGASAWRRWPEFGHGFEPVKDSKQRMLVTHRWRGDRVTGRAWPAGWRGGGALPWTPLTQDELDYERGAA